MAGFHGEIAIGKKKSLRSEDIEGFSIRKYHLICVGPVMDTFDVVLNIICPA